jgi:hypothetical protein
MGGTLPAFDSSSNNVGAVYLRPPARIRVFALTFRRPPCLSLK